MPHLKKISCLADDAGDWRRPSNSMTTEPVELFKHSAGNIRANELESCSVQKPRDRKRERERENQSISSQLIQYYAPASLTWKWLNIFTTADFAYQPHGENADKTWSELGLNRQVWATCYWRSIKPNLNNRKLVTRLTGSTAPNLSAIKRATCSFRLQIMIEQSASKHPHN